jgi:hypothetical protein
MQMVREVKAKKKLRKVNIVEILCTLVWKQKNETLLKLF